MLIHFTMTTPIRDKTALLRKQHIVDAAIRVFAAHGYHGATTRDVAKEAGVADGTIYNSFENKAALLLALLDPLDVAKAPPPPSPVPIPDDPEAFIRSLIKQRWETFTPETLDALRVVFSEVLINPELRDLYITRVIAPALTLPENYFNGLAATGKIRPVDVRLMLRTLTAMVTGLVMLRLLGDAHTARTWDQMPDQLADLLLHGLLPAKSKEDDHDFV
jgi:AcrR family transcriptional regulator